MSVLLIGATGRTGVHLASRLHLSGAAFRVLIRDPAQQRVFADMGAQAVVADLRDDFSAAFDGIDTVIYAAGSAETEGAAEEEAIDREAVIRAVDYARHAHCRCFILISTLLAGHPEDSSAALRHYALMKKAGDDHLMSSGLSWLVIRPGTLNERPGAGTVGLIERQPQQRQPVSREDVAHLTVAAWQAGVRDRVIGFSGGETPIDQVVHQLAPGH